MLSSLFSALAASSAVSSSRQATDTPSCRVSPQERRWELAFALLVMFVTTLPYALGFLLQGDDWVFTGFVFGLEDGNSYLAKMLAGYHGAWLFRTPYTTMPQGGVLLFLPYLLLGKLAGGAHLHLELALLLQAFRWLAGLLMIRATHDFLAWFVPGTRRRRLGLALAVLGGGLGWLLALAGQTGWLGSMPLEFYSPETFGFLGLFGFPHLPLARALLLWALLAYLRLGRLERPGWRDVLPLSLLWLGAGLCQPLTAGIVGLVILAHLAAGGLALRWGRSGLASQGGWPAWRSHLRAAVLGGLLPGGYVLYFLAVQSSDAFMQVWTAQNIIRSPHPLHYLLAYGVVLPFAVSGARQILRCDAWDGLLLAAWALMLPLLAYAPLDLQRRLPEAGWVALSALAVCAPPMSRKLSSLRVPRGSKLTTSETAQAGGVRHKYGKLQLATGATAPDLTAPFGGVRHMYRKLSSLRVPRATSLTTSETAQAGGVRHKYGKLQLATGATAPDLSAPFGGVRHMYRKLSSLRVTRDPSLTTTETAPSGGVRHKYGKLQLATGATAPDLTAPAGGVRHRVFFPWLPLSLCFPSTVLLLLGATLAVLHPSEPLYLPSAEASAFTFLAGQAQSGEVALASFDTSNHLPAWAPLKVLIGHGPESAGLAELAPQVQAVYSAEMPAEQRLDWLRSHRVRYVFYGPQERALGGWNPAAQPCLAEIYAQDGYAIYEVETLCN